MEWLGVARETDRNVKADDILQPILESMGIPMLQCVMDELEVKSVGDLWKLGNYFSDVEKVLVEHGASESDAYKIGVACFASRDLASAKQAAFDKAGLSMPRGSRGKIYDQQFLDMVAPLYDLHMGVENMGPMLYSLVRFIKPKNILEIGAGYTSIFLLQALADNQQECADYAAMQYLGICKVNPETPWCVSGLSQEDGALLSPTWSSGKLFCVDNLAHEFSTANKVVSIANLLGIESFLNHIDQDAWVLEIDEDLDFMWVDFGAGQRLDEFFRKWWPKLKGGGYILVHSTVTNVFTREWLEYMRSNDNRNFGLFETISFVEPHKMFQNSFSMFQKRDNFQEPIHTKYP